MNHLGVNNNVDISSVEILKTSNSSIRILYRILYRLSRNEILVFRREQLPIFQHLISISVLELVI